MNSTVVIVGAGPTGLTAATLLAQYGVECLVFDRWESIYPQPRAVHLDDEIYRLLARIGVAEEFAAISWPCEGLRLVDKNLRVLAEFRRGADRGRHGYPEANMFDQPELESILRANLTRRSGVTIRGNAEVTGLTQDSGTVRVDVTDRVTGRQEEIRADYVLGCDGANSLVRASIGASLRDLTFAQRWLVVDVATDADLAQWEGVHQVCDPVRAATYMRIGDRRYRWEFRLTPGETADDYRDSAQLHPLISPWTKDVPVERLEIVRAAEYTFRAQVADRWRDRRVFLLGDAAHLTPPFIGQGLGAGLRDAANLAWKLAAVLAGSLPETVLHTYQTEREPHARALIRLAKLVGTLMTEGGELGNVLRGVLAPRLHLLARVGRSDPEQRNARAAPFLPGDPATPAPRPGGQAVSERAAGGRSQVRRRGRPPVRARHDRRPRCVTPQRIRAARRSGRGRRHRLRPVPLAAPRPRDGRHRPPRRYRPARRSRPVRTVRRRARHR